MADSNKVDVGGRTYDLDNPFERNQYVRITNGGVRANNNSSIQSSRTQSTKDTFDPQLVADFVFGNTRAPKGHYIYNYLAGDRGTVSGIASIGDVPQTSGFVDVTAFAGRIWYLHSSGDVLFSRVIENRGKDEGYCYQDGDPTSETTPDILDSDGGVIRIEGIYKPKCFMFFISQLVIAAENGIWVLVDEEGVFSAGGYGISKVSDRGITSKSSYVNVNGVPTWWSETGIYCMSSDQQTGYPSVQSITKGRIQTLYDEVPALSKRTVRGVYDKSNSIIQWFYKEEPDVEDDYHFTKVLLLNTKFNAWHKYTLSELNDYVTGGITYYAPYVGLPFEVNSIINTTIMEDVVDNNGDVVTDELGNAVQVEVPTGIASDTTVNYIVFYNRNVNTVGFTFGNFTNRDFVDWQSIDTVGANYDSFMTFAYELNEDMVRYKQSPYIVTCFNRTEENWIDNGTSLEFDYPSSCYLSARWDWADTSASNRISSEQQVYRLKQTIYPIAAGTFDNGYPLTVAKTKVRGRGRAVQLNFRSEDGKDFDLIGWGVSFTGSTRA